MNSNPRRQPALRALIVDDETDICYLLSNILRKKNFQTTVAGTLEEASKLIESQNDFSLIFLDNHLPDGYGTTMINKFKEKNPSARLVMITAHDTNSDKEKAVRSGADYFIGKPFSSEIILNTIERFSA